MRLEGWPRVRVRSLSFETRAARAPQDEVSAVRDDRGPVSTLRLAKLLVKKGDTAGAQEQLDSLLAQWKNADADFLPLAQAKTLAEQIKK